MSKYLRNIRLYTDKKYAIQPKESGVKIHFGYIQKLNYYLNKVAFNGVLTINLLTTDNPAEHLISKRFGEILEVLIFIDNKIVSKKDIISYYSKTLIQLSKLNDCNSETFGGVIKQITDIEEIWTETLTNRKWNTSKNANCFLSFTANYLYLDVKFFLSIENKQKQKRTILFSEVQNSSLIRQEFEDRVKKIYWENDSVIIIEKSNQTYWSYNVDSEELDFHFHRADIGDAHGQYELAKMYLNGQYVLKDTEKAKYWLAKSAQQNFKQAVKMLNKMN